MTETPAALTTTEMHTGGEPVRIVESGYPPIPGATILAKRRYARENLDHLRRLLMHEPRGHPDMYGVIPVEPDLAEAHMAVLFMHNEGYSTMCGHAVIALGRYAVDKGLVPAEEPETEVRIQCPCGLVIARTEVEHGRAGRVRFTSVPAFAFALDKLVETPTYGPVVLDIGYGGAFYAVLAASSLGLDVRRSRLRDLTDAAVEITAAVKEQVALFHPDDPDLGFLYGTILTDGKEGNHDGPSANVCVFADAQVDRSPTGSGITARTALRHRRGLVELGQLQAFESVTGALFTASAVSAVRCGPFPAVMVEVTGEAHYTGTCRFTREPGDQIGAGFLLR